jgi:PAS domain S-box-containing protein
MQLKEPSLNVLVVEDNPGDFILLRECLLQTPVQVGELACATTFDEAAVMLREKSFDLIFLDLSLPDTTGSDTFLSLKPYSGNIPVIILSGMVDLQLARQTITEGAQDYLLKDNLDAVTLAKSVSYSIERARYNEKLRESEERYRDMFEMNPIPMYYFDEDTLQIIRANQAAQTKYEYTEEEFAQLSITGIRPPEEKADFLAYLERTRNRKGLISGGRWTHLKKDGTRLEVEIHTRIIREGARSLRLVAAYDVTEKQRVLDKLLESERRFRYIAEHFPNGTIAFLDRDLNYVFAAGGDIQWSENDRSLLPGTAFSANFAPEDAQRIGDQFRRAFLGEHVAFEVVAGEYTLLINAVAAYDGPGEAENILVVSQNITQLKRAMEKLHFQSTVLENVTDGVIITDPAWKIAFWNSAATDIFGFTQEEMIGKDQSILAVDPGDGTDTETIISRLNAAGSINLVVRRKTKEERVIWVELKITYNYDVKRNITGLIWVARDITDIKAEEHLLKLFQSVILNANDAVLMTEATPGNDQVTRKIVFVNEAFRKITGYRPDEIIGKTLFTLTGPLTRESDVRNVQGAMLRWENHECEMVLYRRDESAFWVNLNLMPVSDQSGNFTHWVFILRDITESRRSAEKMLEQNEALLKTNNELDRFVYSASHDLRAPLTSVLGLTSLMRKESFGKEAGIYLDKISESIQRLDKLIQNIINYSRNSRLQPQHEPIDFRDLFETTISMHQFMAEDRETKFLFENSVEEPFYSDPERWKIILNNLVSNSIKFARPGTLSQVFVSIERDETSLIMKVEDNGIGIPAEQMGSIFEMFYRATTYSSGSGLGLYIVKQTVEMLGGKITAESVPNVFTRFIIRMPFASLPTATYAEKSHRTA